MPSGDPAPQSSGGGSTTHLEVLAEAASPSLATKKRTDAECRAMAVAYCHHRSRIRRALDVCDAQGQPIPSDLREALSHFVDDTFRAGADSTLTLDESIQRSSLHSATASPTKPTMTRASIAASHRSEGETSSRQLEESHLAARHNDSVAAAYNRHVIADTRAPLHRETFNAEYRERLERINRCRTENDRRGEIRELQGLIQQLRGDPVPDPETTGRALCNLGDAQRAIGDDVAAEAVYFDWFLVMEKSGAEGECVKALTRIGQLYHDRGRFKDAERWYAQASERASKRRLAANQTAGTTSSVATPARPSSRAADPNCPPSGTSGAE